MGFYTTTSVTEKPHPETPSCAQKTASGKFFTYPIKTQYENRHNSLKTNQEKPLPTQETASGVFYYKFRHYSAELGRWLGRDPIEEKGGINLYGFVGNEPIRRWDKLGLITCGILSSGSNVTQKGVDGAADRKIANASDNETWIKPGVSLVATWYLDDCTQSLKVEISGSVDSTSKNAAVGVNASFKVNAYSESRVCKVRRTETSGNYTANDSWDDIGKVAGAMKMIFTEDEKSIKVRIVLSGAYYKDPTQDPYPEAGNTGVGTFPETTPSADVETGAAPGGIKWNNAGKTNEVSLKLAFRARCCTKSVEE